LYSLEEKVEAFSILDGIPIYLKQFDESRSIIENIREKIIEKGSFLHIEPEFLLREELREPRNYFLILKAISFGNAKFGEVVNYTQLDKTLVSKYLDTLSVLHIVEKIYPSTTDKERTRDARYRLSDNFVSFWFRFIYPNKADIERGEIAGVVSIIKKDMNSFIGRKFEKICQEALIRMNRKKILPFQFRTIGGWWHKDREIDIIAANEETKDICFCECKWQSGKTGIDVLKELQNKAKFVDFFNTERKEYYMIISKSGFTKSALIHAADQKIILLDLKYLGEIFAGS
jgi:AAA+ ATPase superfamily predicted ATPase